MIGVLVEMIICGILALVIVNIMQLLSKLVLEFKDKLPNATENLLNDQKVVCAKSNCFVHSVSLVIICVFCHFHYTKHRSKQKYLFIISERQH